jgi:hypothetical protein
MLRLNNDEERSLRQAVEQVRSGKAKRRMLSNSAEDAWAHTDTKFADPSHDIQLKFDYSTGNIPADDESKLRFIMQMVQNQGTDELASAKIDFTRDSETWIAFFARYPLLFDFRSRRSKTFTESDFSLSVNAKLFDQLLDAKAPDDVKAAFKQALQDSSGAVLSTTKKDTNLQYLALMRGYDVASTLTIYRAQLNMKVATVKTLCGGTQKANLDISYDEVVFEINNALAIAMYPALSKLAADKATAFMQDFFTKFAEKEFKDFDAWLHGLGK